MNKLSEEEICGFMKDTMSVTISREQLMNPTKEFVVNIYARFLQEFGIENVAQPDIISTSGMDNIERYEMNIILSNITKSVASIVENAGVPDMSFADLVQPKKVRTMRIISALCMLYYKLINIEAKFSQMQNKCADLPVKRQAVEQRIREMKKQIDEKAMYLSSNKSKTQGLAKELKELAETYESKRTESDQMLEETRKLKTLIHKKRETICDLDVKLNELKVEINDLEQRIVKSPDRLQADTKEKEAELEQKRNEKKKTEKQYMELIRAKDFLTESNKSLMPSLETFIEAFKDIENLKTQCETLCQTKVTVAKKEELLKTLKVQIKEQEKTLQTLKSQIFNNDKQFQKQIQTTKQISDGLKKEYQKKSQNKTQKEKNVLEETSRLKNRLNELEVQQKAFKDLFSTVMEKNRQKLQDVKNLIENRMNELKKEEKPRKVAG